MEVRRLVRRPAQPWLRGQPGERAPEEGGVGLRAVLAMPEVSQAPTALVVRIRRDRAALSDGARPILILMRIEGQAEPWRTVLNGADSIQRCIGSGGALEKTGRSRACMGFISWGRSLVAEDLHTVNHAGGGLFRESSRAAATLLEARYLAS